MLTAPTESIALPRDLAPRPRRFAALLDSIAEPPLHLVLRLSVLLLLLHGGEAWILVIPVRITGMLALLSPVVLTHPLTWLILLGSLAWGNALQWYLLDNHKYLMVYWTAVCALAAASAQPLHVLRHNARILVAIGFTLAVVWKLCTPEFLDGRFLGFFFLTDPRIEGLAAALSGIPRAALAENRAVLELVSIAPHADLSAELHGNDRCMSLGRSLAAWTLAIEGAVAVAFCWKESKRALHVRNGLLLTFLITTYPVLPVVGFAFMLAVLALASSSGHRAWTRIFAGVAVFVSVVAVPWQTLLA